MSNPTKFRPEMVEQVEKLARLGATDQEIAEFFNVSRSTLYEWRMRHEDMAKAMIAGKEYADARVERSLYERAVGYSFNAEKIMQYEGEEVRIPYIEHCPPEPRAIEYWLNNRKGADWKSKVDHTHGGKVGLEMLVAGEVDEPGDG